MKHILLISILFLFSLNVFSQIDSPECKTEAIVKGFDISRCACCGGWVVEIQDTSFRSRTKIPGWVQTPGLSLKKVIIYGDTASFPINVRLSYNKSKINCHRFIDITGIEIIE